MTSNPSRRGGSGEEELDTGVLETLTSLCPNVDAAMAVVASTSTLR
jgi:hypothetical protein